MPTYSMTGPDGKTYSIDGPPGATQEQVAAQMQAAHANLSVPSKPMDMGDVASGAVKNFPASAGNLIGNIYTALRHPLDTGKSLTEAAGGEVQKLEPEAVQGFMRNLDPQAYSRGDTAANNVNQFYTDRYGSAEGFKKAVANDPAGVLADAATVAGGVGMAAKAGGVAKIASAADRAGTIANPFSVAGKLASGLAKPVGNLTAEGLGVTTGAGPEAIKIAYDAGREGGPAATALANNLRGVTPLSDVVGVAKSGIDTLAKKRGDEYVAGMRSVNSNPATLSFDPVDSAIAKSNNINNFEGIDLAESTAKKRADIANALLEWKTNPNPNFSTAAGFDALKRKIGDSYNGIPYDRPADKLVVDNAYNAVKDAIVKQDPTYADTMQKYSDASDNINELRQTLSLKDNAPLDTSIRKLQSTLRNNVNTNYGRRTELAQGLADNGAPNLMEMLAGQSLAPNMPRGLGKAVAGGEIGSAVMTAALGHPAALAALIPALAVSSPRLAGELALAAGKTARLAKGLKLKPSQAALVADELGNNRGATALSQ